jgi:hypothetical protein
VIGDNHFKCGGDDTTVEWLCLKLRDSHGFVSIECNVDSIKTYSIGTDGMNGYLERV